MYCTLFVYMLKNRFSVSGSGSRDEERLVRDLFRGYNKLIRPVQNMTQKVEVAFGLAFIQLISVVSINIRRGGGLVNRQYVSIAKYIG